MGDKKFASDVSENRKQDFKNKEDILHEDDGFFSDVPTSGSLSKSLMAMNKYVKKNLLYDKGEYDEDIAYFSKESSPNESVFKCDSDSLQSNDSFGIKQSLSDVVIIEETENFAENNDSAYFSKENSPDELVSQFDCNSLQNNNSFVKKQPVDNAISEKKVDSSENNNNLWKESIPIQSVSKCHSNNLQSKDLLSENNTIRSNINSTGNSDEPVIKQISGTVEQTDDHKSMQLLNNSKHSIDAANRTELSNECRNTRLEHQYISASLTNLASDHTNEKENGPRKRVVFRENSSDIKKEENRHTVHDFTDWVNRATIYPDVYAPLPYKSPRRYVESDVNIHYRCPVRHDPLPLVPERELARQQAEHMKRLYREQKRNKYLQELQDMQNRRHQDNFTPSQKTILPLNRYDEAEKIIARALYAFNGQTSRELSFRKGEMIHVRRQIDANWYEGELHGRIGLFPYNYIEILKGDAAQSPRKPVVLEGRARAKFDFNAQTNLELPLKKGELVVLTRRIDQNWWEGRNGNKTGIFPDSYVTVLQEPSQSKPEAQPILSAEKPVASPAAHGLLNGTAKRSMGSHSYMPHHNNPALSNAPPATQPLPGYVAKPAQATLTPSERGYGPPTGPGVDLNNTEPLFVDTNAEAVPYRAMYKYRPQNPDELELNEGDTVYVLEQCDDGWYVGSSQRTGRFGTFPGNYVERI